MRWRERLKTALRKGVKEFGWCLVTASLMALLILAVLLFLAWWLPVEPY